MSEPASEPHAGGAKTGLPPGWRPSRRGILGGLFILLAGWFVVTQIIQRSGPKIAWIENDLAQAEQTARQSHRLVFLLLYERGCRVTADMQRNLFPQRQVRQRLAQMVCCRIALKPDDPLRQRFYYRGQPLMLVLSPGRDRPIMRPMEGKVELLEFITVVDAALRAQPDER